MGVLLLYEGSLPNQNAPRVRKCSPTVTPKKFSALFHLYFSEKNKIKKYWQNMGRPIMQTSFFLEIMTISSIFKCCKIFLFRPSRIALQYP